MPGYTTTIWTTAPAVFDMKPLTKDSGPQFLIDGEVCRKVVTTTVQLNQQMEMYNSERTEDGEPAFFAMTDKAYLALFANSAAFRASHSDLIGDTDMPRNTRNTKTPTTTTPKAPVTPAPIRPTASPATPDAPAKTAIQDAIETAKAKSAPAKPVLGEHLQRALDLKKQREAEQAKATQAMLAEKAKDDHKVAIAAMTPAKPLIMTPSTPVPAVTSEDILATLEKRVVKVHAEVKAITQYLDEQKPASRIMGLEVQAREFTDGLALLHTQQGIIDTLLGTLDAMTTRMTDLESAFVAYMVDGAPAAVAPAKPLDVFDVLGYAHETMIETPALPKVWGSELDAPATPRATVLYNGRPPVTPGTHAKTGKVPRTIPARGTGAMAKYAHLVPQIREMVDAGFSQKDIAVHLNICGEDGKPSGKVVWHLLHKK